MSFKPEVKILGEDAWVGNALRFATQAEAQANVEALRQNWMMVGDVRVIESDDPVNYRWETGVGLVAIEDVTV